MAKKERKHNPNGICMEHHENFRKDGFESCQWPQADLCGNINEVFVDEAFVDPQPFQEAEVKMQTEGNFRWVVAFQTQL